MFSRFFKGSDGHPRHRRGTPAGAAGDAGFGAPMVQQWAYRPLPGAGALQWAYEALALPRYTPIGAGVHNKRQFRATGSNMVMVAVQGVTLNPIQGSPVLGDMTGQFVTQPLLDVQLAEAAGIQGAPYSAPANSFELPSGGATF